jgi:hypothetical protein
MALSTPTNQLRARPPVGRLLAFALVLAFGLVVTIASLVSFVLPDGAPPARGTMLKVGYVEDFALGTVTTLMVDFDASLDPTLAGRHPVHMSRSEDGSLLAILGREPWGAPGGFGCAVPWRGNFSFDGIEGWFRDPCRGSTFDRQGLRVFGPAPRHLDLLEVTVAPDGAVRINISRSIERPLYSVPPPPTR